jgi:hypothetical protein
LKDVATAANGHKYLFVHQPMSYHDAEAFAEKLGGHLLTISSREENESIRQLLPSGERCRLQELIPGDEKQKPTWKKSGTPVDFVPNLTNIPPPPGESFYWISGHWFPVPQDKPLPFIVKWD